MRAGTVLSIGQITAVRTAFRLAGYGGPLSVAPVASEDERLFVLSPDALAQLRDVGDLAQFVGQILGRKVFILNDSQVAGPFEDFG